MSSSKRQLPIHVDKWIVTVREGKDLTRGDGRDSFFSKMSPVCELTLGDQGPFSTGIKVNTSQPQWDDSVEFEARPGDTLSPPYRQTTEKLRQEKGGAARQGANGSANTDGKDRDDGGLPLPPEGPKLFVVCYSRSPSKGGASGGANRRAGGRGGGGGGGKEGNEGEAERRKGRVEVGKGEVTLSADGSLEKTWVHLIRKNASGSEVPAGSITLEYMFVPGIPRPAVGKSSEAFQERGCEDIIPGKASEGIAADVGGAEDDWLEKPARKLTLLLTVTVMMVAVLTVRLRGVYRTGVLELSPIPVPFKLTVGKHKGSSTHHVRLHEDGNVVVAMGPKPPPLTPMVTTGIATTTTLWESGPLRSSQSRSHKSTNGGGGGGGGGDVAEDRCKKCQVRVAKDGTMALARGREELAIFSPPRARAFFDVVAPREDGNNDKQERR